MLDKLMGCQKLSKLSTNNIRHSRYLSRFAKPNQTRHTYHQTMLPSRLGSGGRRPSRGSQGSSLVPQYLRRACSCAQMDLEYTYTQMMYLLSPSPSRVYKLTSYRKQTKDQWARDDPGFVAVLSAFLLVAAIAYGIAFQVSTVSSWIWLIVHIYIQFFGVGLVLATLGWWGCNMYLRETDAPHSVDQDVEWLYAFDVHCNAFFPLFVLLYVVQYILLPFLLNGSFIACLVGNTLYLAATGYYFYFTFLGYMILPFLDRTRTNVFLYPIAAAVVVYIIALIARVSASSVVLGLYLA